MRSVSKNLSRPVPNRPSFARVLPPIKNSSRQRPGRSNGHSPFETYLPVQPLRPETLRLFDHEIVLPSRPGAPHYTERFKITVRQTIAEQVIAAIRPKSTASNGAFYQLPREQYLFALFDALIVDFRQRWMGILESLFPASDGGLNPEDMRVQTHHFDIALGQFYAACVRANPGLEVNAILKGWNRENRTAPRLRADFSFPQPSLFAISSQRAVLTQADRHFIGQELAEIQRGIDTDVFGQVAAKKSVFEPFLMALRGMQKNRKGRPMGVVFWLGGSGVGKTSLAKSVAKHFFGYPDALYTIRGPEIGDLSSLTRFFGAAPTWIGYGEDIPFFEWARRNCGTGIVLVDEASAACPEFFDLLLTMTGEDGVIENAAGTERVETKNILFILTDNLGNSEVEALAHRMGFNSKHASQDGVLDVPEDIRKSIIQKCLRAYPTPLRGRFDSVVVFHPLNRDIQTKIVATQLDGAILDLANRVPFRIQYDASVVDYLVKHCIETRDDPDAEVSARDLNHTIEAEIIVPILKKELRLEVPVNGLLKISSKSESQALEFSVVEGANAAPHGNSKRRSNPSQGGGVDL